MSVCCEAVGPQVSRLDFEAVELLKHGYVKVYFLAFYRGHCGRMRAPMQATADKNFQ
jgi:hypothetical protein